MHGTIRMWSADDGGTLREGKVRSICRKVFVLRVSCEASNVKREVAAGRMGLSLELTTIRTSRIIIQQARGIPMVS